ncbi:MAG: LysR family transcriptional regulator [Hyphomicrobiaceae bacterium]|nr:LysR family transcriptional regulator [Hyphomicrobiaceae bacterium]
MRRDLDLALLRAFLAVVETGGVTSAARLLNRTQAAVSLQIKRLEEALGVLLFERGHKRLTLAPAGEQLIGYAQRLVAMNDEAVDNMTTPSFEGEVRLGLPVDLIVTYAAPILRRFNERWPAVRVSLVASNSHELVGALERGEIDLAITTDLEAGGRGVETLARDDLVWVGQSGGSAHRRAPLPLAIGGRSCRFRPVVLDALRRAGIDWRVVLEVANQDAVNATIAAGISVAVMLRETVPQGLEVLPAGLGLPDLPTFAINLRLPPAGAGELTEEMARHIRAELAARASLRGERLFAGKAAERRGRRTARVAA